MVFNSKKRKPEDEPAPAAKVVPAQKVVSAQQEATQGHGPELKIPEDAMARDLMALIQQAIELWAQKYGLENMPKDMVFRQAMVIMRRMDDLLGSMRP